MKSSASSSLGLARHALDADGHTGLRLERFFYFYRSVDANAESHGEQGPPQAETPREFGDYELLEEIGRGGQGVVFRAWQKSLNRTVAVKLIGIGRLTTSAHMKRLRREAEAAAKLNHPGDRSDLRSR